MRGLIGKKIGMTRVFDSNGQAIPVTVLEAGPCQVTQIKSIEKDGYESVQVGYSEAKIKHLNKPKEGHFNKHSLKPMRILAEFKKVPNFEYKPGQIFNVGLFKEGDYVTVSGKSPSLKRPTLNIWPGLYSKFGTFLNSAKMRIGFKECLLKWPSLGLFKCFILASL
jgi:hypothetical protein